MMDKEKKINLECLFCFSTKFMLPEKYEPKPGDMIQCANCGKKNDYGSMMRVVENKAEKWAEEMVESQLKDIFKDFTF